MKQMVAYTHMLEFMPLRESRVSGLFLCMDGLVYVYSPLLFKYLTNDLDFFLGIAITLNITALTMMVGVLRVPESLKWHLTKGHIGAFWRAYEVVRHVNNAPENPRLREMVGILEAEKRGEKNIKIKQGGTFSELRKMRKYGLVIFNLILMFFAWTSMSFGVNLLTFYTKYLPGDTFNNSLVIGLGSFTFLLAGPLASCLSSRRILPLAYLLALSGALSLYFSAPLCAEMPCQQYMPALALLARCGFNLAQCFIFIIHTELFPTFFLATSYGLCSSVARCVTMAAPLVAESADRQVPLAFMAGACFLGGLATLLIRKIDKEKDEREGADDLFNTSVI